MNFTIETDQDLQRREDVIANHLFKIKNTCEVSNQLVIVIAFFCSEVEPSFEKVKSLFHSLEKNPRYYRLTLKDFIIK